MLKVFLATCLCLFFASSLFVSGAAVDAEDLKSANETMRVKRNAGYYGNGYGYGAPQGYYNWYNVYPTQFTVSQCNAQYSCPPQCPGTCGHWSGLNACRCNSCPIVGNCCSFSNIARGLYLHAFPHDPTRYVQCDNTPGVVYIRNCPVGLVFDPRFSVCNYPTSVFPYWGKK